MSESTNAAGCCSLSPSPESVVRLRLTGEQAEQLTPLVLQASGRHENVIFFAVAVPFWSLQDRSVVWELQVTKIPARLGQKVKKLILTADKQ